MATAVTLGSLRQRLRDRRSNRGRIAAVLRQKASAGEIPNLGFGGYFKVADAICDTATEANNEELDAFIADAVDGGTGAGFDVFESKVSAKLTPHGGPFIDLIVSLLPILLPLITGCLG